jgi:predicted methyltransferase
MPQDATAKSGYIHESYVIKMAEGAGFKLAGKSEINANPKDKADHKGGVWALPPTLTNGAVDRDKYQAIGESDRMTLKFVKP